ncbi:MFS transporter [Nocardioides sp.]|uniref:MFS transporter n=1 Tax=Nocardioides sp. TaxID=35761 RepID=UPI00262CA593|nr:MFS transporter [Nocardioides sp.]
MTTGHDDPRRWWALAALGLAVLTLGFDITIMNVALPTIATELQVGTDALQWMVNAYVLVIAGLMLTCGALGDRYGRKRALRTSGGDEGVESSADEQHA